jgi:fructose-1,6-bisphosphatase
MQRSINNANAPSLESSGMVNQSVQLLGPKRELRLIFECNALGFIAEHADDVATECLQRILDIEITELHQRTAFFVGSKKMVTKAQGFA